MLEQIEYTQSETKATSATMTVWRGINVVMGVFFVLAAYVQLNDPDLCIWVPAYVVPSIFCFAVSISPSYAVHWFYKLMSTSYIVIGLIGSMFLCVGVMRKSSGNPLEHEEGRELGGILIALFWTYICRNNFCTSHSATTKTRVPNNLLLASVVLLSFIPLATWGLCFIGDLHKNLGHCKGMFTPITSKRDGL